MAPTQKSKESLKISEAVLKREVFSELPPFAEGGEA